MKNGPAQTFLASRDMRKGGKRNPGANPAMTRRSRLGALAGAVFALHIGAPLPALAAGSALEALMLAFAQRKDENAMQALQGIEWKGISYPTDSEQDNSYTYFLKGQLRLSGFGEVDVPAGVGANQTATKANEGDASIEVRFSTSRNPLLRGPNRLVLIKLYPSADYVAILRRDIPGGKVVLLADDCTRDALGRPAGDQHAAYFRIDLPAAPTAVFVRASRNAEGGNSGPGDTTLDFSLFTPGKDLTMSECKIHNPNP